MTIAEAIIKVLKESSKSMTSEEIYQEIIRKSLYEFGARDPKGIVNGIIRRHTVGINFSTASPVKHFVLGDKRKGKTTFTLKERNSQLTQSLTQYENISESDILPEEELHISYEKHIRCVQDELLGRILDSDPVFFEHLVVDLLIKMGYGGNDPQAGSVTPATHDGGIDGVINQDKLGLDKIYIQAKRYAKDNKIDKPKLQQFVGAMENVQKGVYLTTSDFTEGAKKYVDKNQKNIMLINGDTLTALMVKYQVGISIVQTFATYKIDMDYFSE